MKDYSGFYYNVAGIYQDLIYYISPMPEQKLYMIKKYNPVINTSAVLKSIETGFNGYDYEVYAVEPLTYVFENPNNENEECIFCNYFDFSNKQVFEGVVLVPSTMPNHDELVEYLEWKTCELPIVVDDRKPVPLFPTENKPEHKTENRPVQQPVQPPRNFNEQLETPQMKAQEGARTIASQIVQNNDQPNNQE